MDQGPSGVVALECAAQSVAGSATDAVVRSGEHTMLVRYSCGLGQRLAYRTATVSDSGDGISLSEPHFASQHSLTPASPGPQWLFWSPFRGHAFSWVQAADERRSVFVPPGQDAQVSRAVYTFQGLLDGPFGDADAGAAAASFGCNAVVVQRRPARVCAW